MKCIRHRETGEILRLSDHLAKRQVATGHWQYIPKGSWKRLHRPNYKAMREAAAKVVAPLRRV